MEVISMSLDGNRKTHNLCRKALRNRKTLNINVETECDKRKKECKVERLSPEIIYLISMKSLYKLNPRLYRSNTHTRRLSNQRTQRLGRILTTTPKKMSIAEKELQQFLLQLQQHPLRTKRKQSYWIKLSVSLMSVTTSEPNSQEVYELYKAMSMTPENLSPNAEGKGSGTSPRSGRQTEKMVNCGCCRIQQLLHNEFLER